MNKDEQLARLLRLKRHEKPGENYFEGFLEDFHAYQRRALVTQSAGSLWLERVQTALSVLRRPATAWAAAGLYAGVMLLVYAWPAPDHAANTTIVYQGQPGPVQIPQPSGPQINPMTPAPFSPGPAWQVSLPADQTMTVSDTPGGLLSTQPGKRRTTDQPQDARNVIGSEPTPPLKENP